MQTLWQDLRYVTRTLLKSPSFALMAIVTLALGIGANTAIFSFVHGVLLRPLPFPAADQLMMVWTDNTRKGEREGRTSYPNFKDWQSQNHVFQGLSGFAGSSLTLTRSGEPERVPG